MTTISNLAMANLRRLPPGHAAAGGAEVRRLQPAGLPDHLKGEGLNETALRDLAQYTVRNQVANVPGASVPQPFGGRYRQIMVYVDPLKLEAHQLSLMDVVRAVNDSNLILPAGDVRIGPFDYNIYTNSQFDAMDDINRLPLKTVGDALGTRGRHRATPRTRSRSRPTSCAWTASARSTCRCCKQGGDTNTIAVVDGVKRRRRPTLSTCPRSWSPRWSSTSRVS